MESYLKQFFIEVYQDPSMYEDYLKGTILLNFELYQKWYSSMQKRNDLFAKTLRGINRPYPNDFVVESVLSENLAVSKKIYNKQEMIVSDFGYPDLDEPFLSSVQSGKKIHYICNGCFMNTLENINKTLERGSFSVGVCDNKHTDLYKSIVRYYNQLKTILWNAGYRSSSFESNCSNHMRVYLLKYDSIKGKAKK